MGWIADTADRFAAEGAVLHFRAKIETVGDAEINSPLQKLLLQLFRGNNERGDPAVRVPPCIGRNQFRKDKFTDCRIGTDTDHRNIRKGGKILDIVADFLRTDMQCGNFFKQISAFRSQRKLMVLV